MILLVLTCFVCFSNARNVPTTSFAEIKYPVILVPGDGGSQIEAKLDKPTVPHRWCTRKTNYWYSLWLNLELLAPYILDCLIDNMRLQYDNQTRQTYNMPGVQTRLPGFGNTSQVEWLDPSQLEFTSYFYHIVEGLVSINYTRNVTVRGGPYDFRKAPNENQEYVWNLTRLVEQTYVQNGGKRVVLLGHSMGSLYIQYLLSKQTQQWKDKYIRSFISLGAPWGGAVKTLRLMASGDNLGVFVVNPLSAREQQRSMPSSAWLLPYDSLWSHDEVLVSGPKGQYTVADYKRFFLDIDFPTGYMMRKDTENLVDTLQHPGVEVHCIHGRQVKTPQAFNYTAAQWHDAQPDVTFGDGDGTVNLRSLMVCERWVGVDEKHPVKHVIFDGAEHIAMLSKPEIIDYIKSVVLV